MERSSELFEHETVVFVFGARAYYIQLTNRGDETNGVEDEGILVIQVPGLFIGFGCRDGLGPGIHNVRLTRG